ncbi:16909_t:CDS:1, partial [Dentiscutata heterogama]
ISENSSSNNNLPIAIGISVGVIIIVILSFAGFLLYKRSKSKINYIPTPGGNSQCNLDVLY